MDKWTERGWTVDGQTWMYNMEIPNQRLELFTINDI